MTATITLMPMIWMPRSIIGGYADRWVTTGRIQESEFRIQELARLKEYGDNPSLKSMNR
jgi:hypothetical protein